MTPRIALFASLLLSTAACATDATQDGATQRGPLGKADSLGSCAATDCDGQAPGGTCWCDAECARFGDCCADEVDVCEQALSQSCGGFAGLTCGEDEYCHYDEDDICGASDHLGTCLPVPELCNEIFAPVCGCDGVTHSNSCFAAQAGTSVASEGACETAAPERISCGGFGNIQCAAGTTCVDDPDDGCDPSTGGADCGGICVAS